MRTLNKILAFVVMGVVTTFIIGVPVMAIVMSTAAAPAAAAPSPALMFLGPLGGLTLIGLVVYFAPSGRSAWARSFFVNGVACLALPFAGIAQTAILGSAMTSGIPAGPASVGATAGVAMGGAVIAGALGFVGLFAAAILFAIAYAIRPRTAA